MTKTKFGLLIVFLLNEDYCNLENYNQYIEMTMTQGQQADLAIVVKYIETLFEIQ